MMLRMLRARQLRATDPARKGTCLCGALPCWSHHGDVKEVGGLQLAHQGDNPWCLDAVVVANKQLETRCHGC